MPPVTDAETAGVYDTATRWGDRCLRRDGSILTVRGGLLWTPAALDALAARIDRRFDRGAGTFTDRWGAILDRAPAAQRRLAAEVLVVHLLVASDITLETKRRLVEQTLPPGDLPLRESAPLCRALGAGVVPTGVAYKAMRLSQIRYLVRAAATLKTMPPRRRATILRDAAACRTWLEGVDADGGGPQREALKHLLHPDSFEAIVSVALKRRIVRAHAELAPPGGTADLDASLAVIRNALGPDARRGFNLPGVPPARTRPARTPAPPS